MWILSFNSLFNFPQRDDSRTDYVKLNSENLSNNFILRIHVTLDFTLRTKVPIYFFENALYSAGNTDNVSAVGIAVTIPPTTAAIPHHSYSLA